MKSRPPDPPPCPSGPPPDEAEVTPAGGDLLARGRWAPAGADLLAGGPPAGGDHGVVPRPAVPPHLSGEGRAEGGGEEPREEARRRSRERRGRWPALVAAGGEGDRGGAALGLG
jgi:hypothetical protein